MRLVSKFLFQNCFKKNVSKSFQNSEALFQNKCKYVSKFYITIQRFFLKVRSKIDDKIKIFQGFCIELNFAVFAAWIRFKVRLKAEVVKFVLVNTC